MSKHRHPAFPEIVQDFPDDRDQEARAAGWLPVVDEVADFDARLVAGIPVEITVSRPTDPAACGEEVAETHSGLGKFRRETKA